MLIRFDFRVAITVISRIPATASKQRNNLVFYFTNRVITMSIRNLMPFIYALIFNYLRNKIKQTCPVLIQPVFQFDTLSYYLLLLASFYGIRKGFAMKRIRLPGVHRLFFKFAHASRHKKHGLPALHHFG
jgi:hypothetical protein